MGGDEKLARLRERLEAETQRLKASIAEAKQLGMRLEAVLAVSRAGTFHWHAPTGAFDCDERVARLFGVESLAAMTHTHLLTGVDEEHADAMQARWRDLAERGVPLDIEVRVRGPGGAARWVGLVARSFACDERGPACIVGACAETTAIRAQLEAERSQRIADSIPQLVWLAGADGQLEYANERWLEYTGHSPERDELAAVLDAFAEEDRLRVRERWLHAVRAGRELEMEARLVARDGRPRWFLVRAVPMAGPGGVIARWAGTCTDIDAHVRAEQELRAARDARDTAIATLGHELRTPLTTMNVTLDLVRARAPAMVRECSTIERQVSRMTRMVDDMLDLARVTGGRVRLTKRPTDLGAVLNDAVEACTTPLRERMHTVVLAVDPHLIVDGDHDRLVQVFVNLVSNAAKYTPPQGHITVSAQREGGDVIAEVRDDGIGIAPELLAHLFEPFVQGTTSSERSGGLGLGLSIARSLVELHGGSIRAKSKGLHTGTTFSVRLPASAIAPVRAQRVMVDARSTPRRRVLIVDDSPEVTEMLGDLLRLEGHEVSVAHDPTSAIELAAGAQPDVALIDIRMPGMDGATLARKLHARLGAACPRLIAVSGFEPPVGDDTTPGVFERWITKPFDVHLLRALVAGPGRRRRRRASTRPKRGPQ
ncbi:MAG: PAS domain-containing protein [Deltaproteobacteria bacterium]|nr:PAS domain-containing protein [Kofleriaceae bacterium]